SSSLDVLCLPQRFTLRWALPLENPCRRGCDTANCFDRQSLMTERIRVTNCAETCSISGVERMCSTALIVSSPSSSSCKTDWHPGPTELHSNPLVMCPSHRQCHPRSSSTRETIHCRARFVSDAGEVMTAMQ